MFLLSRDPQFTAEVKVQVPTLEGPVEQVFTARFRAYSLDDQPNWRTMTTDDARTFLSQALRGWDGIVDDDGNPVAFDADARSQLLAAPWAVWPLIGAYLAGLTPAARGN